MSEKRMSRKSKAGSVKQKPLVECKAVQLGKWVLGNELNSNYLALIRTHIENTVGNHRNDSVTKTRLRFFERGLASGDKPSLLSFGLEQFYPIEDIKKLTRDEKHTNVVFCVIKSPNLIYEVVAFRCPTEYEARQFAEHFQRVKDQSGTGFNIDLKAPPDGHEMNWSMRTTETRRLGDVSALSQVNGNTYESVTNGEISNVHVDKTTKTLHITTSEVHEPSLTTTIHEEEPVYATVDKSQKIAAREAAESRQTTTTTTVTKEEVVLPPQHTEQQMTTTVVRSSVNDEPVVFEVNAPHQEKKVEVRKETIVIPVPVETQQQTTRVVREMNVVAPSQTQHTTTIVKGANVIVPQQTQVQTTKVVREANVVVPAQTQQQTTRVVKESNVVMPAQSQQTIVREVHTGSSQNRESLVVPGQQTHKIVKHTQSVPEVSQTTRKVVREAHVTPAQQTTRVVKEVHAAPRQQQTQVVREVHTVPRNSGMVREVEYNEVSVMQARVISLEQENRYLRELLKEHSLNDKDLEVFMKKETVTNGPLMDSVVMVGDSHHQNVHQTVKHTRHGEAAITVGDYRGAMTRTDSDRSMGQFVKVRKHRGAALDDYGGGSLRSLQSGGSLYASSVRGGNIYAEGQNVYSHSKGGQGHHRQTALNMHHHSHHGDIITQTMATPNAGYFLVPQGTFKKSSNHGHTYVNRPIDKVYSHPAYVSADQVDGSISISDEEDDAVFEVNSATPVKLI